MWLSQRQVRWLIVLLALLPLIPSILLIQVMMQNAMRDRDSAVSEITDIYRGQLTLLIERFIGDAEHPDGRELVDYLDRIFVEDVSLLVSNSDGDLIFGDPSSLSGDAIIYEISHGDLKGWTISLDQSEEYPEYFNEQKAQTFWHAVLIVVGVILIAGIVWFTVHRRLRVDEIRSDLFTTISHEIKTPVAAMKVLIETLEQSGVDEKTKQDYLGLLASENERVEELAEQFLTYSRLERGQIRIKRVDCYLKNFLEIELNLMRPLFESAGGTLHCQCPDEIRVKVDVPALKIVIANLLENALKYGGDPPVVKVEVNASGKRVEIMVRDQGPGIPRAERRAVFRKFYRSDALLHRGHSGVGLGLAICRHFLKLLKGKIEVSSPGAGEGATFTVSLPAGSVPV